MKRNTVFFINLTPVMNISQLLPILVLQRQPTHLIIALASIPPSNPEHEFTQISEHFVSDVWFTEIGIERWGTTVAFENKGETVEKVWFYSILDLLENVVSQDSSADMFGCKKAWIPTWRFCCLAGVNHDFFA